jgi:hypothetical protein
MSAHPGDAPPSLKLLAAKLWEKTSAAGNRYLIRRLGGVRILILENRDRGAEDEGDFHLFFVDGSPREDPRAGPPASAARPGREPRRRYQPRQAAAPIRPDRPGAMPDDRVDDIGRG